MVGKQGLQAASEKQNKVATTKDSIIVAAENYRTIMRELTRQEQEKGKTVKKETKKQDVDLEDLKNAEKIVLSIEGR